jgi:hypothetical protein
MSWMPFHFEADAGQFYAVAWCPALHPEREPVPVRVGLYFSPSVTVSRFTFHAFDEGGEARFHGRGPEHSNAAEAALLDAAVILEIPVAAWRLVARQDDLLAAEHAAGYQRARREVARALYSPRMSASLRRKYDAGPLMMPPPDGFPPVDAFEETDENRELLRAIITE